MQSANETKAQEVGIPEVEQNKIFVTMNATFKDQEKCRIAMETIVKDAHAAYGVNSHFWFQSKDGKSLFVLEQYEDKKALSKAIMRFTSARISFFSAINVVGVSVYGSIAGSSKLMFAALSPHYTDYFGGFSKEVAATEVAGIKDFERNRILVATTARIIEEGKCKETSEALVKAAYAEQGTYTHFYGRTKDGKSLFVLEQYADEEALIVHAKANQSLWAALFESIEIDNVKVYGTESVLIKERNPSLTPTYMSYFGGYSK